MPNYLHAAVYETGIMCAKIFLLLLLFHLFYVISVDIIKIICFNDCTPSITVGGGMQLCLQSAHKLKEDESDEEEEALHLKRKRRRRRASI